MARKEAKTYACDECGYRTVTWAGRCPACGSWGSIDSDTDIAPAPGSTSRHERPAKIIEIREPGRFSSKMRELDLVLGGGFVEGSVVLIGGEPGIGKSTLLLQVCGYIASSGSSPLYVSGEESASQIASRAARLGFLNCPDLFISAGNVIEKALEGAEKFDVVVLDSVQAFSSEEERGWPGTPSQVRAVAQKAIAFAKNYDIPVIIVGHITRAGTIAGPKLLEHMVDVVLQFSGEKTSFYRTLRSQKNRYGSTDEIGIFEMNEEGLRAVKEPGRLYWNRADMTVPGVAMSVVMEGSIPFVAEIQSLAAQTSFPYPKRGANGIDSNKLHILTAVLDKRCGISSSSMDVYLNVTGGLTIREPFSDLAIAMSLASSVKNFSLFPNCCFLGEVGLAGEIRPVPRLRTRVNEAARMGFNHIFISDQETEAFEPGLKVVRVKSLSEILEVFIK